MRLYLQILGKEINHTKGSKNETFPVERLLASGIVTLYPCGEIVVPPNGLLLTDLRFLQIISKLLLLISLHNSYMQELLKFSQTDEAFIILEANIGSKH